MSYLTVAELERTGNVLHAPHTVLVSRNVRLGTGNVFYPNVVLDCADGSSFTVGDGNRFYPNLFAESAGAGSAVEIGDGVELGPGLVIVRANQPGARVVLGSRSRVLGHAELFGRTTVGAGAQVLGGPTTLVDVVLEPGESHAHPDYDARGAVVKGVHGFRGLTVPTGMSALPPIEPGGTVRVLSQREIHTGAR